MIKKKEQSRTSPEGGIQAAVDHHAWKVAKLAAILSTRIPLCKPDDSDEEAWDRIAGLGREYSPYNLSSPEQDEIYMGCLKRANFLLSNVPGAGRDTVFAEDLFLPGRRYTAEAIADVFKSAGWPGLTSGNKIRTCLGEMRKTIQDQVADRSSHRPALWTDPLLSLESELSRSKDEGGYEAHALFALSREVGIPKEKFQIARTKLNNPPAPQIPAQQRPWNWQEVLRAHYQHLLDLKPPWLIQRISTARLETTLEISHRPICGTKDCDEPCENLDENVEEDDKAFRLGSARIRVLAKRFSSRCLAHGKQPTPKWPTLFK